MNDLEMDLMLARAEIEQLKKRLAEAEKQTGAMTRGDRIRAMSDEELAEALRNIREDIL